MNEVLGNTQNQYAIAYIDDIIVYSKSEAEHIQHLADIFDRLDKAGLKLKLSKCSFFQSQVKYLGHIISSEGISPDPEKVKVMRRLQAPKTVREVRSIVGMASYYRRFIPHFSEIAKPLTELTKKNSRFVWSEDRQQAFKTLKECLSTAPVLAHPDFSKPFKLYTDASLYAVGAVLTQEFEEGEKVIQYLSKQMTDGQQKWPTIEREAYAIVHAVNKLRHFLLGHKFTVFTDHKPLRSLFSSEMKNARVQHWAIILDEYGCDIQHKSGKSNVPADMLSRIAPSTVVDTDVVDSTNLKEQLKHIQEDGFESVTGTLEQVLPKNIRKLQRKDPELELIIQGLKEDPDQAGLKSYVLEDQILYHVSVPVKYDKTQRLQLVVPVSLREGILQEIHASEYIGGHLSTDKTYDKLRMRYFWENMYRDVINSVNKCRLCCARRMKKVIRPLQDMPEPNYPFEIIGIDTCGPFPETAQGNKYIVTIVDHFSSWPEAYPVPNKTAETVASLLIENFIPTHACPQMMLSDRGTEFVNSVISLLLQKLRVIHLKTSPFHPQTNGKAERFHRYMNDVLTKYVQQEPYSWDKYIPCMLMSYRTSVNDTTLFTPYFLVYGRDPVLPMDTLLRPKLKYMGDDYVLTMVQRLHVAFCHTKQNMFEARERNKRIVNKKAETPTFQPGDAVYYYDCTHTPGESSKLKLTWTPHFRIIEQKSPVNYLIKNQLTGKSKLVHAENLRPALP